MTTDEWPERMTHDELFAADKRRRDQEQAFALLYGKHRMTVDELRAALVDVPGDYWVTMYDPRLDRRLWVDHIDPGHGEIVGVLR